MSAGVFALDFSNRVIEHLGIKLYQNKPTNVVAEFVSNSWDADARRVEVDLAGGTAGGPEITIIDNGRGMDRRELIEEFLVIGRDRRTVATDRTPGKRAPMGRKGIGKLAGFGIAGTVDIISVPNPQLREQTDNSPRLAFWLRFKLSDIIAESKAKVGGGYKPQVVADNLDVGDLPALVASEGLTARLSQFLAQIASGEGGVAVLLRDTTLKKSIDPKRLLKSLGSRFTVTLLRPDFVVSVNSVQVSEKDAFPPFQDFGFGTVDSPLTSTISIDGVAKPIKYWVRFVALGDADWSIESAGVGVYAHGKIAQDRPFFFGVKGKEILSRYLYGVIEADWLDELDEDVVSTDRRSLNWEHPAVNQLHEWGRANLLGWVEAFRKWKTDEPKKEIVKKIRKLSGTTLSGTEEEALAQLLSEVLVNLGNDELARENAIVSFTEAWTHEPTRRLTSLLWGELFAKQGNSEIFPALVERLKGSLVPEAMGLAVTVAQRVAAITAMRKMIESDKTETHLQRLIEEFPWLLGPQWERLTANQTIRTLVKEKHKPDPAFGGWTLASAHGSLKPDFVFLSDVAEKSEIVVFELKGPECGKTLQYSEYRQLVDYLDIIRQVYTDRDIRVHGVLVGHDKGGFEETDKRIDVVTWSSVLASARALHVSYLGSLLKASEPSADDARLRQIADFGGKETLELLNRLAKLGDFDPVVAKALESKKS